MCKSYEEVLSYLDKLPVFNPNDIIEKKQIIALDSLKELLDRIGNPQDSLKYIHVGGTNGKGSTCVFIRQILIEEGYLVGGFNSPELLDFREQITVNNIEISKEETVLLFTKIEKAIQTMKEDKLRLPSRFEIMVSLAFLFFLYKKCDVVVLEVGLGGRDDATNIIDSALVTVLTTISLEHTELLGDTLSKIAEVKSGIIKENTRVVCYPQEQEAFEVIKRACEIKQVPLCVADMRNDLILSMKGKYQLNNASLALEAIALLEQCGYKVDEQSKKNGLVKAFWPARFEILCENPLFILDGGHNLQCAKAVRESLEEYYSGMKFILLLGVLGDKNYQEEIKELGNVCSEVICITPNSERAVDASVLADICKENGMLAVSCDTILNGVKMALESKQPVLAFGSLYSAGEIRKIVLGE